MKIIGFITDHQVIWQILNHLNLWSQRTSRDPPDTEPSPKNYELVYELFDDLPAFNIQADGWYGYDESCTTSNETFPCTLLQDVGMVLPFFVNSLRKIG